MHPHPALAPAALLLLALACAVSGEPVAGWVLTVWAATRMQAMM